PSAWVGSPTTSTAGVHSASSAAIAVKRAALAAPTIVVSGCAVRSIVLPTATPILRVPKSKASTVWCRAPVLPSSVPFAFKTSGVSDVFGKPRKIDAQEPHRRGQPRLGGHLEHHLRARGDDEPGVLRDLLLKLSGRPAGVAQRY